MVETHIARQKLKTSNCVRKMGGNIIGKNVIESRANAFCMGEHCVKTRILIKKGES